MLCSAGRYRSAGQCSRPGPSGRHCAASCARCLPTGDRSVCLVCARRRETSVPRADQSIMAQTDIYDDVIMDHIKNARNYRRPRRAQRKTTGINPLCGDEMTLYLSVLRGRIEDIAFQCTCCGISMASASIMSEFLRGRDAAEAHNLVDAFVARLDGRVDAAHPEPTPEQEALLAAARKSPSRARCATLAWSTLARALEEPADAGRVS